MASSESLRCFFFSSSAEKKRRERRHGSFINVQRAMGAAHIVFLVGNALLNTFPLLLFCCNDQCEAFFSCSISVEKGLYDSICLFGWSLSPSGQQKRGLSKLDRLLPLQIGSFLLLLLPSTRYWTMMTTISITLAFAMCCCHEWGESRGWPGDREVCLVVVVTEGNDF